MGLQDRDYMHERQRRDPPFKPPPPAGLVGWTVVMVLVVVVLALFKLYAWLLEPEPKPPSVPQPSPAAAWPPEPVRKPPVPAPEPGPARQWVRCTVNGQTLYSDTQCPSTAKVRDTAPAPQSPAPPSSGTATITTLYHCKAYNGGTFWARTHCNQHQALVDRMVNVPGHLPFDQQVHLAEANRHAASHSAQVQHAVSAPAAAPERDKAECKALDKQIAHWDSMARQPQSAQTQDWIREQRKQARDRQFALRC